MPTLPGLTMRRPSASRSNGMWVWPQTTVGSSTPANPSANHSSGLSTRTISSSSRAVAWQNRTGPRPSTSRRTVSGNAASRSRQARVSCRPAQMVPASWAAPVAAKVPSNTSTRLRSQLPRTHTARSPSDPSRSRVSVCSGPTVMSPGSTIASTPAASTSASTASSAGRLPWMSARTATRMA